MQSSEQYLKYTTCYAGHPGKFQIRKFTNPNVKVTQRCVHITRGRQNTILSMQIICFAGGE